MDVCRGMASEDGSNFVSRWQCGQRTVFRDVLPENGSAQPVRHPVMVCLQLTEDGHSGGGGYLQPFALASCLHNLQPHNQLPDDMHVCVCAYCERFPTSLGYCLQVALFCLCAADNSL